MFKGAGDDECRLGAKRSGFVAFGGIASVVRDGGLVGRDSERAGIKSGAG